MSEEPRPKKIRKLTRKNLENLIGVANVVGLRDAGLVVVPCHLIEAIVVLADWQIPDDEKAVQVESSKKPPPPPLSETRSAGGREKEFSDTNALPGVLMCDGVHDGTACGPKCHLHGLLEADQSDNVEERLSYASAAHSPRFN